MANKILIQEMDDTPPQICFANHAGDFNATAGNDLRQGTDTEVELVLLNLADGAYAESTQADLGEHRAALYAVSACIEMQVAVADAGSSVSFYWNHTASSTAATGNMGATVGVAGAYTGYSADPDLAIQQLTFIGNLAMTDDAVDSLQIGLIGMLMPLHRYGSLVVKNNTGEVICDTDDIESHVVLSPIIPEAQ